MNSLNVSNKWLCGLIQQIPRNMIRKLMFGVGIKIRAYCALTVHSHVANMASWHQDSCIKYTYIYIYLSILCKTFDDDFILTVAHTDDDFWWPRNKHQNEKFVQLLHLKLSQRSQTHDRKPVRDVLVITQYVIFRSSPPLFSSSF